MSKAFKSVGRVLKPVIKVAAPIAGAVFGGPLGAAAASALTSKLYGESWGDALKSAALSGVGAGIIGGVPTTTGFSGLDSLNSSIYGAFSPIRSAGSSLLSGAKDMLSPLTSFFSGTTPDVSSAASGSTSFTNAPGIEIPSLNKSYDLANAVGGTGSTAIATPSTGSGLLSKIKDSIMNPTLGDVSNALLLANTLGKDENPTGTLTQQQIYDQMNADKEAQAASNAKFISALNSAPIDRKQTNQVIDYYNYGSRPETAFFDTKSQPIAFAKGGKVPGKSPLDAMKGQADTVDARLSVGEYVIPADVVSHLGDGNTNAGAKQLDILLKNIRKQKAPAMKKGKLPPKSKSPLSYIGAVV